MINNSNLDISKLNQNYHCFRSQYFKLWDLIDYYFQKNLMDLSFNLEKDIVNFKLFAKSTSSNINNPFNYLFEKLSFYFKIYEILYQLNEKTYKCLLIISILEEISIKYKFKTEGYQNVFLFIDDEILKNWKFNLVLYTKYNFINLLLLI